MRIVLVGGGSGGHIFPILAVERELKKQLEARENLNFLFLGPNGELEREIMDREVIPMKKIICGKMRRYSSVSNIIDVFKIPLGVIQSLWHLLLFMPDVVFAKGGYASVPAVIAAWIYQIPVVIHESDVTPGLANQIMSKIAKRIALSFPGSEGFFPEKKIFMAGNPIRNEMVQGKKEEAQRIFSLSPEKKTILVLGGSQGARAINHAITNLLSRIIPRMQIIHVTGKKEYESVIEEAGRLGYKAGHDGYLPYAFLREELPHAFAAADVVISRAGANALTEIAANAKPAIIIPIDGSANKHQEQNAFIFAQAGAAIILEQSNLGENILFEKITEVFENKELNFELVEHIKKFYNPQAAEIIAKEIIAIAS